MRAQNGDVSRRAGGSTSIPFPSLDCNFRRKETNPDAMYKSQHISRCDRDWTSLQTFAYSCDRTVAAYRGIAPVEFLFDSPSLLYSMYKAIWLHSCVPVIVTRRSLLLS